MAAARLMTKFTFSILSLGVVALLCGCAVGPDYVRPAMPVPVSYKEDGAWKSAEPKDVDSRDHWWEYYGDEKLNELVTQANQANQNIQLAEAQYRHANALVDSAQAAYFPVASASVGDSRGRTTNSTPKIVRSTTASFNASWEVDVWGGIRRSVEAGKANAQASEADLAAARLTIQAAVVQDYIQLRITDQLKSLFADAIAAYEKSLRLTQTQYSVGVVTRSDVALAETTLKSAQAQALDLDVQRAQLEHAIAVLIGKAPAEFSLEPAAFAVHMPSVPVGLPSALLERRPDISSAERRVASANANIGVARAAYFPNLLLGGSATSTSLYRLLNSPSTLWSLGVTASETLFDGGVRSALGAQATANYDAAVAQYKQTVLNGLQEVEDNLAALRILAQETSAQEDAVKSAQDAERITMSQYRAGTANFINVTTAQILALTNERAAVQLRGRQFAASVALIKAIGGSWVAAEQQNNPAQPTQPTAASTENDKVPVARDLQPAVH
jgi:NodT family efflux transporter outer membrane factor (OMF) lipoprotein